MKFQEESPREEFYEEIKPLLVLHHEEISQFAGLELDPDFPLYASLYEAGLCKIYTVRTDENKLVGYSIFIIHNAIHFKHTKKAVQDVIYILPKYRGRGQSFMKFCEEMLREIKVEYVFISFSELFDLGPLLKRRGFEICEHTYSKKLS